MMNFKQLSASVLVASLFIAGAHASDETAAAERWTPASLRQALAAMPQGDVEQGRQLNESMMCSSCHGREGIAPTPNWPNVAGQKADYSYKILLDYRSGLRSEDRRSDLMAALTEMLSEQEMADLAAYYASLPLPQGETQRVAGFEQAERLVRKGDRSRLITPCASCHGRHGQGGINAAPALAGQSATAFERTMRLYGEGKRHNDVNASMSQFAGKLTDEEIRQLAEYYSNL